jgi:hypothetical protein
MERPHFSESDDDFEGVLVEERYIYANRMGLVYLKEQGSRGRHRQRRRMMVGEGRGRREKSRVKGTE